MRHGDSNIDVNSWSSGLDPLFARIAGRFGRAEPRRQARSYLTGLLAPIARKNGWQLAEAAGDTTPDRMQRLLNTAKWDVDGVRDEVRAYVAERIGDVGATLAVAEVIFPKKGTKSAGVHWWRGGKEPARQAQVGLFLAYASATGSALIDRELHLPPQWTQDPRRCSEAGVPMSVRYRSKAAQAASMIERAVMAGLPVSWVLADETYAAALEFADLLTATGLNHVLTVRPEHMLTLSAGRRRVGAIAEAVPETAFVRLPDDGDQEWAVLELRFPDGRPGRWLLLNRHRDEVIHHLCAAPPGTTLAELVRVARSRETVQACLARACEGAGLHQYQVRRYHAWYRHATLSMLAYAYAYAAHNASKSHAAVVDCLTFVAGSW
ncbi:IS701 family transposase [Micromonospora lupini]